MAECSGIPRLQPAGAINKHRANGGWRLGTIPGLRKNIRAKADWDKDAPMVINEKTKITIAPSPPAPTYSNTHDRWG